MSDIKIFWDPSGLELDSLGKKRYLRATDGDTPYVSISIRMLSIDTPEVHYPGNTHPSRQDENLAQLAAWIQAGKAPINSGLAQYLQPRLATGKAGTLQEEQGVAATEAFEKMLEEKLTKPNGTKRWVYLHSADMPFDQYGRLLAYMAPSYSASELATIPYKDRCTFNLLMVDSGWAASFPIYPSIPKYRDLVMLQESGKDACETKRGAWVNPKMLTGYEFRMCVRLHQITKKLVEGKSLSTKERYSWISRYCLDMTTREMFFPQDYYNVKPYNRIFVWADDAVEAVANLNLVPA
jgi:endonuclease YncB( thermonuclease family)